MWEVTWSRILIDEEFVCWFGLYLTCRVFPVSEFLLLNLGKLKFVPQSNMYNISLRTFCVFFFFFFDVSIFIIVLRGNLSVCVTF